MAERTRVGVMAELAGRPEDYTVGPEQIVYAQTRGLIQQYAAAGGDLRDFDLTVKPGLVGRSTHFAIRGYQA